MNFSDSTHPQAPASANGPGVGRVPGPLGGGANPGVAQVPGPLGGNAVASKSVLSISGVVIAGPPLSDATIIAVNQAAKLTPPQWRRFVAYADQVKVGGSLAWRANNPGNLRDAGTKIGVVTGGVGKFAVFATLDAGRAAQKALYLNKYGDFTVKDAINKLTPPSENDTEKYLSQLTKAGVDISKDVKSQIDVLMVGVEASEGLIKGTNVPRTP
jgi:hypothetical protein